MKEKSLDFMRIRNRDPMRKRTVGFHIANMHYDVIVLIYVTQRKKNHQHHMIFVVRN
jgi:hypothetical protein